MSKTYIPYSTLPIVSLYIICIIYLARMCAIYWTLSYRSIFTLKRIGVVVVVFWIVAATYSATPFFCAKHYKYMEEVSIITFSGQYYLYHISLNTTNIYYYVTYLSPDSQITNGSKLWKLHIISFIWAFAATLWQEFL